MAFAAHRWIATARDTSRARAALDPAPDGARTPTPFVEPDPLDLVDHVFEAVHRRDVPRRARLAQ